MAADPRLGTTIADRYRLDRVLGTGGAGIVYAAEHVLIGREVAVKILRTSDEDAIHRFLKEARATVSLRHPHVVEIFDMGETGDGAVYLAMELLEGQTLSALLKNRLRLDVDEAFQILLPIMSAVAAVHERGLIHRDLKPGNIMLAEVGERRIPKLLDFGLVRQVGQISAAVTQVGVTIGTPHYMAPEQVEAQPDLGPAVDVWGMSVIWYRCLTGQLPFEGPNPVAILMAVANGAYRPIDELADLPADLAMLIGQGLRTDPGQRPKDLGAFLEPFVKVGARYGVSLDREALPDAPPLLPPLVQHLPEEETVVPGPRRGWLLPALLGAVLCLVGAGLLAYRLGSPIEAPMAPDPSGTVLALLPTLAPDAGPDPVPSDAAVPDTGPPDSGVRADAGMAPDAAPPDSGAPIPAPVVVQAEAVDAGATAAKMVVARVGGDSVAFVSPEERTPPPVPEVGPNTLKNRAAAQHFRTAMNLRRQGRLPEAIASLDEAIKIAPEFVAAINSRGLCFQDQDEPDRAIADFDRALALEPDNAAILNNRGTAHFAAGHLPSAMADLERAVRVEPKSPGYRRQLGQLRLASDDPTGAVADLKQAMELDGGKPETRFGLAQALQKAGDDPAAQQQLDQVLAASPGHTGARYARAMGALRLGDRAGAKRDLLKLLELDPRTKYRSSAEKQLGRLQDVP